MTPNEIRSNPDLSQYIYQREIAAQLAELVEQLRELNENVILIWGENKVRDYFEKREIEDDKTKQ